MEQNIKNLIKDALQNLSIEVGDIILEHPADLKMGDYSTNVALAIAKNIKTNPKDLSDKIVAEILRLNTDKNLEKVESAGPGFINFYLSRKFFSGSIEEILNKGKMVGKNDVFSGQKIMIEYTAPNPFKPFHIGHLMTNAIGESIARILEHSGAAVSRANYQGDVGLHVAKAIWGLMQNEKLQSKAGSYNLQAANIGRAYAHGAEMYETDEGVKKEIDAINMKLYDKTDEKINEIYQWGFDVTMKAFEDLYGMLGTKFDYYFLESVMADIGRDIVKDNMDKVFEESDSAIVFKAEKYNPKFHTRVFITSANLPTYENRMKHITHGMMRFVGGKMSSRKGNVITGESLLNDVRDAILEKMTDREFGNEEREKIASDVAVAAIKYSILKQSIGGDIIYDFESSISFEGDSGPYLQYSYARANSVLEKAQKENILPDPHAFPPEIFEVEKLLYKFPEIVFRSVSKYEPHYIVNYLIETARAFNSFYGNTVIASKEDKNSPYKVALTYAFSFVMKTGLHLLGIETPVKM